MNYPGLIEFVKLVGKSKKIKRTGWVREKVKNPESIAEHSFRTIVIAMILAPHLKINREKLIKMAIIHDLGEIVTGDIIVERGKKTDFAKRLTKEEKEKEIIDQMFKKIDQKDEYSNLFKEMIKRKSEDAKLFWQIDKLERTIQALEYEEEQKLNLEEFFENAKVQIKHPLLKKLLEEVMSKRILLCTTTSTTTS